MHRQGDLAVGADLFGLGLVLHRGWDDARQPQIAGELMRVHGADHVFPDEVERVVGLIAQVGIQLLHRLACRIVEVGFQRVHKAAALKKRALFLAQQFRRADQQRIVGKVFEVVGLDIDVPLETAILELLGKNGLVPLDGIVIVGDHGHVIPILLQLRALDKALAVDDEVRLDVHRQIIINVLALERIGLGAVVDGQAPEVEILILGHGVKHLFQRAHGTHQGRVGHDDLVKLRQLIPAIGIQRRFVGPDIQALVLAHNDVIRKLREGRAALGAEFAVADHDQFGQVFCQICEVVGNKFIYIAVFLVEEENAQSFHS